MVQKPDYNVISKWVYGRTISEAGAIIFYLFLILQHIFNFLFMTLTYSHKSREVRALRVVYGCLNVSCYKFCAYRQTLHHLGLNYFSIPEAIHEPVNRFNEFIFKHFCVCVCSHVCAYVKLDIGETP